MREESGRANLELPCVRSTVGEDEPGVEAETDSGCDTRNRNGPLCEPVYFKERSGGETEDGGVETVIMTRGQNKRQRGVKGRMTNAATATS